MIQKFGSIAAAALVLVLTSPPPYAGALTPPVVDPAALPPAGPPGPSVDMTQRSPCAFNGALPGFDPVVIPPSQQMLNLPEAWKASRGAGVSVAIIDSGVTPQPRLPNLVPGGDYIDKGGNGLTDCDGHGTAVAGLIGGAPGPDGFSGVAPEAQLVSIRQSSAQWAPREPGGGDPQVVKTGGDVATLARAIRTAADIPGVKVINLSVTDCIPVFKTVDQAALGASLHYAVVEKDIVVVAAAGNVGENMCASNPLSDPKLPNDPRNWTGVTTISTPSFWQPYVLSVGSLNPAGQPSSFTMAGPWVGIAAPGESIVSLGNAPNSGLINAQPSNQQPLVPINGTSFSSAYVSGVAALVRSKFPQLSAHQVINRLVASAHNAARAPSNEVGTGVIDPVAALTWDIPDSSALPTDMPVVHIAAPAPKPHDNPWPRVIALASGALLVVAALATVIVMGRRRDRSNHS